MGCYQAVGTVLDAAIPALAQSRICQLPRAVRFHRHEEEPGVLAVSWERGQLLSQQDLIGYLVCITRFVSDGKS